MPFNTALTRTLGIKSKSLKTIVLFDEKLKLASVVPVVQGGMHWVGYAELAAAVSNAGGLGLVSKTF